MKTHYLIRTNKKGEPGRFRCGHCGLKNLTIMDMESPCKGLTAGDQEDDLLDAINFADSPGT